MAHTPQDPAGTTHQFQNFADEAPPQKSGPNVALIGGVAAAAVVVLVLVVLLVKLV